MNNVYGPVISHRKEKCNEKLIKIRKCIAENAHTVIKPEVYQEKYDALAERYDAAKSKLESYQEEILKRRLKRERIETFLTTLQNAKNLVDEFDEGLWNTMVESLTVYSYARVVFLFRDGTTIECGIRK